MKLSTYTYWYIEMKIIQTKMNYKNDYYISNEMYNLISLYYKKSEELFQEWKTSITTEDLKEKMWVSRNKINNIEKILSNEKNKFELEFNDDKNFIEFDYIKDIWNKIFNDEEMKIFEERYEKDKNLEEIAKKLWYSIEHISKKCKKIENRLKKMLKNF